jgi:hypothetical protein
MVRIFSLWEKKVLLCITPIEKWFKCVNFGQIHVKLWNLVINVKKTQLIKTFFVLLEVLKNIVDFGIFKNYIIHLKF